MKIIAYCRTSTDNQKKEATVDIQEGAIKDYIKGKDFDLVKIFKDEGVSGGLSDRPALNELLDYLENNKDIENVIIYKLDRLARDVNIQGYITITLKKRNCGLISTKEPDLNSDDPYKKAFINFIGILSELEKEFITMRLTAGRLNKAKKGGYAGGGVACGYKNVEVDDKKDLIVDLKSASIVKQIFKLKRKKKSLRQIAQVLNDEGVPTARNGKWQASTISYILNNKIYQGNLNYKDISVARKDLILV